MSLEGQQIDRYHIVRLLGSGGMGEVYLAEDARIEQQVALKVIRAEVSPYADEEANQQATRLFQREAKAIAKLDHPHILPLYDYGEQHLGNLTMIYLVMPYRCEGSLSDWLRQRGQAGLLSPQEVAHIVRQAASALQHAHDRQIVHQDVKPSNFLIRHRSEKPTRPDLLLADFGVAKLSTPTTSASQTVRGTPTYMAPEQWAGQPEPATDQYALAVMAYELLTGRPPFLGPLMQVMYQHLHTPPSPPSFHHPRLTAQMDTVFLHALAKQPEERFLTISAFADALEQAVKSLLTKAACRPAEPSLSDLRATLIISTAEAVVGTHRTLTLPGGRKVSVSVPAGASDGQVIRLPHQGDPTSADGPRGTLILTLAIQPAEQVARASDRERAQQRTPASHPKLQLPFPSVSEASLPLTALASPAMPVSCASNPHLLPPILASSPLTPAPAIPASGPSLPPITTPPGPPAVPPVNRQTAATRPSRVKGRSILLIGLALLVIASGMGLFSVIHPNRLATTNANATATVVASNATGTTTAFHPTATAQAQAQAQASATAAVITANPDPYGGGTLVLYDPLRDNSLGYKWDEGPDNTGGNCQFAGGAYHVSESNTSNGNFCEDSLDFSNFAFEVQMTIMKGDSGGITFRIDKAHTTSYVFFVTLDGWYVLSREDTTATILVQPASSSAIHRRLGQTNVIAVVAQGSTITLYVNRQQIAGVTDSTYGHGLIGVIASPFSSGGHPTEVVYSNARVWTF